jgi:hypothetical protein
MSVGIISIFQPPVQILERHDDVGAIGGAVGERAIPVSSPDERRSRDIRGIPFGSQADRSKMPGN